MSFAKKNLGLRQDCLVFLDWSRDYRMSLAAQVNVTKAEHNVGETRADCVAQLLDLLNVNSDDIGWYSALWY